MTSSLNHTSKEKFYDNCFVISIFSMMGILVALPYQNTALISLCTYVIAICAVVMCAAYYIENFKYVARHEFSLLILALVCVLSISLSNSDIRTNVVEAACFLEIPMFMLCGKGIKSKRPAKTFLWGQYILSFFYLYLSLTSKSHYFVHEKYGPTSIEELTLAYRNPNETSMYLFACFLSLIVAFLTYKRFSLRVMFGVNAVFVFRMIWMTQSRAGIVSSVLAIFALVLFKIVPVSRVVTKLAIAIPWVMVAIIYFFNEKLVEINFLGSSVETGRLSIFDKVFANMTFKKLLFGDFAAHSFDNLHNVYISVFGTIGIFGVILYASYLSSVLISQSNRSAVTASEKMAYFGVLLLMVYSSVEATFFVGGSAFAMCFIGVYTCFVSGEIESSDEDEEVIEDRRYYV